MTTDTRPRCEADVPRMTGPDERAVMEPCGRLAKVSIRVGFGPAARDVPACHVHRRMIGRRSIAGAVTWLS